MWEGAGSEAARVVGAGWYWLPYLDSPLPVTQASCTVFQILSERVGVGGDPSCCSSDPISPEDLPRQGMRREVCNAATGSLDERWGGSPGYLVLPWRHGASDVSWSQESQALNWRYIRGPFFCLNANSSSLQRVGKGVVETASGPTCCMCFSGAAGCCEPGCSEVRGTVHGDPASH